VKITNANRGHAVVVGFYFAAVVVMVMKVLNTGDESCKVAICFVFVAPVMVTTMFMCTCLQLETQMAQQKARPTGQQLVWQTVWPWASQKDLYVRVRSCVRVRVRNACIEFDAKHEVTCESMPSDDEYVLVVAICP